MKKKIIAACIIIVLMLTSMAAYLFYIPLSDEVIIKDGNRIYYPQIPYYSFLDECGGALYNNLSVSEEDKKTEEYMDKIYEADNFWVSDYENGICINRYVGNEKDVVIPEKINGKNVIKIGQYFERSWDDAADGISCSKYIFKNAFYGTEIESVFLPGTVKEIVSDTFCDSNDKCLKKINVSKENPYYLSVNGILFSKKPLKVLCIPGVYYLD